MISRHRPETCRRSADACSEALAQPYGSGTEGDGSEQTRTFDGEGNCVRHVDAIGGATTFEYTDFDRLTARTGPDGVRYEFSHDISLNLTRVTNPQGLNWDYEYDPVGQVTSETDFDERTMTYERDEAGRLISRTNALGQAIRYERDELDRVVRKDAAGAVTTFAYDFADQLAEAVNPDSAISRLRDRYGRLKSETVNGRTTTFAYDELGRRTGRHGGDHSGVEDDVEPVGQRPTGETVGGVVGRVVDGPITRVLAGASSHARTAAGPSSRRSRR